MPSKKHISSVSIDNNNIPDGSYAVNITPWGSAGTKGSTVENLSDKLVTFTSGSSPDVLIDSATGTRCEVSIKKDTFPFESSALFGRVADGSIEMFADETLKVGDGAFDSVPLSLGGSLDSIDGPVFLPTGESVFVKDTGSFHLAPNGAYDDMDPNDTRTVSVPYTIAGDSSSEDIWTGFDEGAFDGGDPNEWSIQGNEWYTANGANGIPSHTVPLTLSSGDSYTISVSMRESTLSGDFGGDAWFYFSDVSGNVINNEKTVLNSVSRDNYEFTVVAPVGAVAFSVDPKNGCRVDFKVESIVEIVPAEVFYYDVLVKGPRLVGPKLVAQSGFSGTNWTQNGNEYTHTTGSVSPLTVDVTTTVGKIIQISCNTKNTTAGSVTVAEATESYSTVLNDGDVWLVRADSANFTVNYTPTSDFDGVVYDTFVREWLEDDEAADLVDFTVTQPEFTGDLEVSFKLPPVAGRRSDTEAPTYYRTGEITQNDDYALRWDNETESAVIENGYFKETRSGIAPKSGGTWMEIWNVQGDGGFTEEGAISPPLIDEDTFVGSGWTFATWGYYTATSPTNNPLSAPLTMPEGTVLHVRVEKLENSTGTIVPQAVGDTTIVGVRQDNSDDHVHDIYLVTCPANMTTFEYMPNTFQGQIKRLNVAEKLRDVVSTGQDKFKQAIGTASTKGPQFSDVYVYYFEGTAYERPMSDTYETSNTDGLVLPKGTDTTKSYKANAYCIGYKYEGIADGCIDAQVDLQLNHSDLVHGRYCLRWHYQAHHIITNTTFTRHGDTQATMMLTGGDERGLMYNCYIDGVRCTSINQMIDFKKVGGMDHVDDGAIVTNLENRYLDTLVHVCRSRPYMAPEARVAMTDMEFEYKLSSSGTWLTLTLDKVGLPAFIGRFKRQFPLGSGTYDFRARARNGIHVGNWSTLTNVGVT
jgi:hypothetical protein